MTVLWPIAVTTFKEGVRNRALYGITLIALLLMGANFLVSGMIPRDIGKVSVDMALSMVSFCGLLVVLFVCINLIAKDLDKRTIYMVLSRPISRTQYIFGKFAGMALLVLATVSLLAVFSLISVGVITIVYPAYTAQFSWTLFFVALFFTTMMLVLLTALSFFFASFTSSSFTTLVLTVVSYVIGHSLSDVKALVEAPQAVGIQVSPLTVKAVQFAYYIFPNLSLFDIKLQAAHGLPLTGAYIFWVAAYGAVYTCLAITLSALIFRKREFP